MISKTTMTAQTTNTTKTLQGALTALITPFDAEDRVDTSALSRIVEAQITHGIDGLVALGTTGESATLSIDEQEIVVKTVIESVRGRVPVVVGTGSNSTRATVDATKRARGWGAEQVLVVCPYYNKPTQEGLFRHFLAVHDEVGLPIVAYNVPGRTACDLLPETISRLVEVGAIVGVKDATANMIRATETLSAIELKRRAPLSPLPSSSPPSSLSPGPSPSSFALLSGDDFTILPFVAVGGCGVISVVSNLIPGDTAKLVRESSLGHFELARPLHARIVELAHAMFAVSNPIPVKAAMALAGWCTPFVRLPLDAATEATTDRVRAVMHRYLGTSPEATLEGMMS